MTADCTKRLTEAPERIGQDYRKGVTKDCILVENWFYSNKLAEAVMDIGTDLIGIVKKKTKKLCKDTIENLTKYWPGGS